MKNLFERTSSNWVRYSEYEWKRRRTVCCTSRHQNGNSRVSMTRWASISGLFWMQLILVGWSPQKKISQEIQKAIQIFAVKYGCLDLWQLCPPHRVLWITRQFICRKTILSVRNPCSTMDYLDLFFPFVKPDVVKRGVESMWNITEWPCNDCACHDHERQTNGAQYEFFSGKYAEPYEWLKQQFTDISFTYIWLLCCSTKIMIVWRRSKTSDAGRNAAFGGNAPPTILSAWQADIVWDFSLSDSWIQMMFSFMLTDSENPIKLCRHCTKALSQADQVLYFAAAV